MKNRQLKVWFLAQINLGLIYLKGDGTPKDYGRAFELFEKAAGQNDPKAQALLGKCYEFGLGVAKDNAQAKEWYKKAADQGYLLPGKNLSL